MFSDELHVLIAKRVKKKYLVINFEKKLNCDLYRINHAHYIYEYFHSNGSNFQASIISRTCIPIFRIDSVSYMSRQLPRDLKVINYLNFGYLGVESSREFVFFFNTRLG